MQQQRITSRQRVLLAAGLYAALVCGCSIQNPGDSGALAQGVVWQIDENHIDPHGDWDKLGVSDLLVQWTAVDDTSFLPGAGMQTAARLPDWTRVAGEKWARNVIVGLAGRFDETTARAQTAQLIERSKKLAAVHPPVHVVGYYFPVEVDPTWKDASALRPLLDTLPRPLWISVYDRSNIGGPALAAWLDSWLPRDVGVFLQDGCGVYARGPAVAREYADALAARLGKDRVRIIAEAFRPAQGGGFRSATAAELSSQLTAYRGYPAYLFDGPHYVSTQLVQELLRAQGLH
ncbi:alpha-amylase family protein [Paraburkholderia megapolitana]|uniref:Spherulation-specific family 4 n=1 Tax=Paraburkholderia megapolitana TaxID=420953 RepID=A0A1I3Q5H3_9BURK|nr:hypothetical protein [Paraburkholderia megapolitana]QDQ81107.1 hypothetical protein FNZ07_07940 [Paraburkholderia megapolitana]SFJ28641.1 hypothetical protein SAMN05192543_106206 [Paraburkholderia megapolitana]